MEGQVECAWRQARTWYQLMGDICASDIVGNNQIVFNISYSEQEGDARYRFCIGVPQADIECDLYMEIHRGFKFKGSRNDHCLLLTVNLYGQKQAG
jgi:hypothetical protein